MTCFTLISIFGVIVPYFCSIGSWILIFYILLGDFRFIAVSSFFMADVISKKPLLFFGLLLVAPLVVYPLKTGCLKSGRRLLKQSSSFINRFLSYLQVWFSLVSLSPKFCRYLFSLMGKAIVFFPKYGYQFQWPSSLMMIKVLEPSSFTPSVFLSYMQTDTASVLLEVIGYIRFLQSQIEVMLLSFLLCFFLFFYSPFTNYHEAQSCHIQTLTHTHTLKASLP